MGRHVAVKCTYNDGGEEPFVGFKGICSQGNIVHNIIDKKHVWCSQKRCPCNKYYRSGFTGNKPKADPCNESELFKEWAFGTGGYHNGSRKGEPMYQRDMEVGKIAILTTRFPKMDHESERKIIGLFRIGKLDDPDFTNHAWADNKYRIELPKTEAIVLNYWKYSTTKTNEAKWGSGLIRYLDDNQVAKILLDIKETVKDEKTKLKIYKLLEEDFAFALKMPPKVEGALGEKDYERTKRIDMLRKYGATGEGDLHKKLKNWVANNPNALGIKNVIGGKGVIEYRYQATMDRADILFSLKGNNYVVVEIETISPLQGCHQALKYRILKCAEEGVGIASNKIQAFIVAWQIPGDVKRFCNKYGIRYFEKKL